MCISERDGCTPARLSISYGCFFGGMGGGVPGGSSMSSDVQPAAGERKSKLLHGV